MRLSTLWKEKKGPTISFEFFPARDEKAGKRLNKAIDTLAALGPDFVSVTFGAGGSTREGSYQLVETLKKKNLEVLPYVAAYGLAPDQLAEVLNRYEQLGVENILCVRGDQPEDESFTPHPESFAHASDFLTFTGEKFNFCKGAAGYPEGHKEAAGSAKDLEYLELKIASGAEFIITQYCYDNRFFLDYVKRCRDRGVKVPIVAGVMPIYTVKMMENLAALCDATITAELREGLNALPPDDKEALQEFSLNFTLDLCRGLIKSGVEGLHFYTMDRAKLVAGIIAQLQNEGLLNSEPGTG